MMESAHSIPLAELIPGKSATVQTLHAQGAMRRRLQDIGIIQGTSIKCLRRSPLGDPAAYLIRGAVIAIRAQDSRQVTVRIG